MSITRFMEIGDAGLRYAIDHRSSTHVVLIHEMGGTLESWDRLVPHLDINASILRFDFRGFGLSTKVTGINDLDRIALDLGVLLDGLGIREPVHLVGMAAGGAIAIRFAARQPARVASLTAIGPATGIAPEKRTAMLARADRIEREGMSAIVVDELSMTYPQALRDTTEFESYRARWLGNAPASYAATYRMIAALDMDADFPALHCPTLLLAGEMDPLRPPAMIEALAHRIAGAQFRTVSAGHVMAWQAPELLARILLDFWQNLPPDSKDR